MLTLQQQMHPPQPNCCEIYLGYIFYSVLEIDLIKHIAIPDLGFVQTAKLNLNTKEEVSIKNYVSQIQASKLPSV